MKNEYFGVASTILMQDIANGNSIRFLVTGNSMHPFIRKNDYLSVEPVASMKYIIGDIVVARQGEGFLTHRMIAKTGRMLFTKGDACVQPDEPMSIDSIIGRVISTEYGGHQFDFTSMRGKVANAIIGFLSLIYYALMRLIGSVTKKPSTLTMNRLTNGLVRVLSYPLRLMILLVYLCVSRRRQRGTNLIKR